MVNENLPVPNKGLNARQAEVLNSAYVLLIGFDAKLNICAFNPALRQAQNRYASLYETPCTE